MIPWSSDLGIYPECAHSLRYHRANAEHEHYPTRAPFAGDTSSREWAPQSPRVGWMLHPHFTHCVGLLVFRGMRSGAEQQLQLPTHPEAQSICFGIVDFDDFGWKSLISMRVGLVLGIVGPTRHDLTSTENNNQREDDEKIETLNISETKTENE